MSHCANQYLQYTSEHYPHGLVFHYFHGDKHRPAQGAISAEQFEQILIFLGPKNILPAAEWLKRAETSKLRETDLCITFDDGLREQFDIAVPVMRHYGITAFFFVYSSPMKGVPADIELYRHVRNACFPSVSDFYNAFDAIVMNSQYTEECTEALKTFDHTKYLKQYSFHPPNDKKFRFLRDDVLGNKRYDEIMQIMKRDLEAQGKLSTQQVVHDL